MNWCGSTKPRKMSFVCNFKNLPVRPRAEKSLSMELVSQSLRFTNEFTMGIKQEHPQTCPGKVSTYTATR